MGTFLMVYFLHKWQNYAFTKLFLFPKSFNGLPISLRKKSEVHSMVPQDPQDLAPSTFLFTNCTRHMKEAPATGAILHPVSSALKALLPFVVMAHSLTSFRSLCKCLPFRDACPSQLSFYPFIFLYAIYHNLRICLLYDSLY